MNAQPIITALDAGVLTVTINDPATRNAITSQSNRLLHETFVRAALDQEVRVVVLTGTGEHFCSGGNFKAFGKTDPDDRLVAGLDSQPGWTSPETRALRVSRGGDTARAIYELNKPTIAKLRGTVAGSALALAAACDFRIAEQGVQFHPAFLKIGLCSDSGAAYFLTRLMGSARATEFLIRGIPLDAGQALKQGLLTEVHPEAELGRAVADLSRHLSLQAPLALHYMKRSLHVAAHGHLNDALAVEADGAARCLASDDAAEAARALQQRRPPAFQGR